MLIFLTLSGFFLLAALLIPVWSRGEMPGALDSLRTGRLHHLLIGFAIGTLLNNNQTAAPQFDAIRNSLMCLSLIWIGFRAGLDLDLARHRRRPTSLLLSEALQSLGSVIILFVVAILSSAVLRVYFSIKLDPMLLSLLLAVAATSVRTPEVLFYWGSGTFHTPTPPAATGINPNTSSLIILTICLPFLYNDAVLHLGPYTSVGSSSTLVAILTLGMMLGVLVDFIFRGFEDDLSCAYLSAGVSLVVGSFCLALNIPGILVGFLAGVWLINTTIRRRTVLELSERVSKVAEPVFFFLLGSLLGTDWFTKGASIALLVGAILISRLVVRATGQAVSDKLMHKWKSWSSPLDAGLRPLGTISIAVVVQTLFLSPALEASGLIVAFLFAVYIGQLFPTLQSSASRANRYNLETKGSD
jgi:hypothetical protein